MNRNTQLREASYFLSLGKYETTENILNELAQDGYAMAKSKLQELYYTWGSDLSKDEQYILKAYDKFKLAGDYADAEQVLAELKDIIYYIAIDDYRSNMYNQAYLAFNKIGSYLDSDTYIILIQAHDDILSFDSSELWPMIGFEDVDDIILSNHLYAHEFLQGSWKGDSKYFKINSDGYISYNVPWFNYGDYYRIEDGKVLLYKEESFDITKTLFEITIINENCIQVLSCKNYRSYTLFRQ